MGSSRWYRIGEFGAGFERLTYAELLEVKEYLSDEIARRARLVELEKLRVEEEKAALKRVANQRVGAWVEHERTQCGKKNCRCTGGRKSGHGPYWYIYTPSSETQSGRTSEYVGRMLNTEAAGILADHDIKQIAREELRSGEYRKMRTVDELARLFPEEVYPDEFTEEEKNKVAKKRERESRWSDSEPEQ